MNKISLEALVNLINNYNNTNSEEILEEILECYHTSRSIQNQENMLQNQILLRKYPYYFGIDIEECPEVKVVWKDEASLVYFSDGSFYTRKDNGHLTDECMKKDRPMFLNEVNVKAIVRYVEYFQKAKILDKEKRYFYLYLDELLFASLLQGEIIREILLDEHIIIIVGIKALKDFFMDNQMLLPNVLFGLQNEIVLLNKILEEVDKIKSNRLSYYHKRNQVYYDENKEEILFNIKEGKPKVLFITSRHTTALQYHTRDMALAANKLGIKTKVIIEKSNIHYGAHLDSVYEIYKLKPDIIFLIDHFRFEAKVIIPKNVFLMTWIQDPIYFVMDPMTPHKLEFRDIVLNHFFTWKTFEQIGYNKERLIDAPVPSNHDIYKPYNLTTEEIKRYGCDICILCHASDLDAIIERLLDMVCIRDSEDELFIKNIIIEYTEKAYAEGVFYYSKEEFMSATLVYYESKGLYINNEQLMNIIVEYIYTFVNNCVFRQTLVDWIIDAGYKNIKLWGSGWENVEKYKEFAMGKAENGETLSKIYQAAKIVIGNNIMTTAATRVWESMLSGSFYMSNYIPEEHDVTDIRKILKVDEEFIMFYNKQDLLNKIEYYLTHEEERVKMAKIGREKALEKMTFEVLMKKTMKEIQNMF